MKFESIFKNAKYVSASDDCPFIYVRKFFGLKERIKEAKLYVSVLGFCELYCNGKKVTEDLFVTPYSQYNKQNPEDVPENVRMSPFFQDDLRYSIFYSEFDVSKFLKPGGNAFGAVVAGGWYRSGLDKHGAYRNYGKTKICFRFRITYESGKTEEVVSDGSCLWKENFLLEAGIFHEEQDETKEIPDFSDEKFPDSLWKNVCETAAPQSDYRLNDCPADKIIKILRPKLIKAADGYKIYDVGENITGFPIIKSGVFPGEKIVCTYSERLSENGELDESHVYAQKSVFYTDGRKKHRIRFTWHGFRYFRISATKGELFCDECAVVHADIKNTSAFDSDSKILNWIYRAYVRSQLENYHCGLPTDCPQIERKGYTGDGQLLAKTGMMLFDSRKLYLKWMRDISDCQDRKTGFVHYTAPCFVGCSGGPGGWSVAIVSVPYTYYKTFGEREVLAEYYPQMKRYTEFMDSEMQEGLVCIHKRREACLGDWESPYGRDRLLPTPFVNSCMYIGALDQMTEIAEILGKTRDIEDYRDKIYRLRKSIDKVYYDPETGDYCGNEQGANAFALKAGLGDARTLKNMAERYRKKKSFDTGIFGTEVLTETLFKNGFQDVAYELLDSEEEVSFKAWMKDGATTLYESWKNARSLNHPMFGAVVRFFFEYILGIRQTEGGCAFKTVHIHPLPVEKVSEASGELLTVSGRVAVSFKREENVIRFRIEVPEKAEYDFFSRGHRQRLHAGINEIEIDY